MVNHDIKIIGLDLDWTLLDSDKNLSSENYQALKEAADRGIEIVPCTGRFYNAMPDCIRELPFVHYSANINGADVVDLRTGKVIYSALIPLDQALEIMDYLDHFPELLYDCYQDNKAWITARFLENVPDYTSDPHSIEMIRGLRRPVPELRAYLRSVGSDVQKVQLFTRCRPLHDDILEHAAERFPGIIATCSIKDQNVEFNHYLANKGTALTKLAEHLGFSADNVLAFGDGTNDIPMIKAAGIGVAMANACPGALTCADLVTLTNDENGVAKVIRELCLS